MRSTTRLQRVLAASLVGIALLIVTNCGGSGGSTESTPTSASPASSASPAKSASPKADNSPTATQATTGSIEVKSSPPGAAIMLVSTDEGGTGAPESKGVTPAMLGGIAPGKYTVDIELNGYHYYQKDINLKAGATIRIDAKLKKQ